MKKLMIFFALFSLFSACNMQESNKMTTKVAGHSLASDKYVILIQSDGNLGAHRLAMKKAVRLAKLHGYRYFKVLNQGKVSVLQNGKIIEQNFADQNLKEGYFKEGDLKSAYKLTIRCYKTRPFFGQVIDTCRYGRWLKLNR